MVGKTCRTCFSLTGQELVLKELTLFTSVIYAIFIAVIILSPPSFQYSDFKSFCSIHSLHHKSEYHSSPLYMTIQIERCISNNMYIWMKIIILFHINTYTWIIFTEEFFYSCGLQILLIKALKFTSSREPPRLNFLSAIVVRRSLHPPAKVTRVSRFNCRRFHNCSRHLPRM